MLKIILVDDHQIFLQGLSLIVEDLNFQILGTAANGDELMTLIKDRGIPDILVLDIEMPGGMDGITAASIIREKYPHVKIIMLSMHKEKDFVLRVIKLGIHAYVLKDSGKHEFSKALNAVVAGNVYVDALIASSVLENHTQREESQALLSNREIEIIQLIADQKTTSQIATQLFLSKHTVETHRKNILFKLDLKNSAGLVKYAFQKGLIK